MGTLDEFERYMQTLCERLGYADRQRGFIETSAIARCRGRNCTTSCAPKARSSPPWASARAPGKPSRAIMTSAGLPSSVDATCPFVVNNARFFILSWIGCQNLPSRVLALVSRRLADDWCACYAYRPVFLEAFVEKSRYRHLLPLNAKRQSRQLAISRRYAGSRQTRYAPLPRPAHQKHLSLPRLRGTFVDISATNKT